jgi:hypothetical protein
MNLITLAKSIQPFIQKNSTLESIYKQACTNTSLPFKNFLKPIDLIKVVFMAKKISNGDDPREILTELDNNMFLFSIVEFGDDDQSISCERCFGDGAILCRECGGSGESDCNECGGSGEDEEGHFCPECDGAGEEQCSECGGTGSEDCSECNGQGYEETNDYVPYTISYYVSYDETLKNNIEEKLLRNDTENPKFNYSKTFLLAIDEVSAQNGDSGSIKNKFANTTHLLEINTEEASEDLVYGNNRVIPSGFYDDLDKFM